MATNEVLAKSSSLRLAVASTVSSGDPVMLGEMGGGVALTDWSSHDSKATVVFQGVFDLSVKAVNIAGNTTVAVGDALYYFSADTPKLSKKSAGGAFFGYALEAISSSGGTATINVAIGLMPPPAGYGNSGYTLSAEQTGTGSSQNVAHNLGSAPTAVAVILTEFASNLSVDVAEGTHTSTNAVVTVTSGAKFKVLAIK